MIIRNTFWNLSFLIIEIEQFIIDDTPYLNKTQCIIHRILCLLKGKAIAHIYIYKLFRSCISICIMCLQIGFVHKHLHMYLFFVCFFTKLHRQSTCVVHYFFQYRICS